MPSDSNPLGPKDARLFDQLTRQFENGDYGKAVRTAQSILDRHPSHTDSMCFKGLCEHQLGQRETGFATIKEALRLSGLKSAVAWRSLGMCHRHDRAMIDAIKCFKQSLRLEPNNISTLRDLSSAYIHVRDWNAWLDVRRSIIGLKVDVRANWVSLSCAHRMLKQYDLAFAVLDVMLAIMDAGDTVAERSELHLYRIELAMQAGKPDVAKGVLEAAKKEITPSSDLWLLQGRVHEALGDVSASEAFYGELIQQRLNECDAIAAIARLKGVDVAPLQYPSSAADRVRLWEILCGVAQRFPSCDVARRWALDVVPIDNFRSSVVKYIVPFVRRMIPSIVSVLKGLYDPLLPEGSERVALLGEVFLEWERELSEGNYASFSTAEQPITDNPVMILSVWEFLAAHFRRLGNYERAHAYIDMAIAHTPTVEMLYLSKAKICMREGHVERAAELADTAARMDRQDKYLNSKAAKYRIRANDIAAADALMCMFYKSPSVTEAFLIAIEFQCYWYEREVGDAMFRMGDVISALQYYLLFAKHHADTHSELYDFHAYAMRRQTMRQWFDVIAVDDDVTSHPLFLTLCPRIVKCYLAIASDEAAVRAAHKVTRPTSVPKVDGEDNAKRAKWLAELHTDVDMQNPLEKARPYVEALVQHRPDVGSTHTLAAEYYAAFDVPLLELRALVALASLHKRQRLVVADFNFLTHQVASLRGRLSSITSCDPRVSSVVTDTMSMLDAATR